MDFIFDVSRNCADEYNVFIRIQINLPTLFFSSRVKRIFALSKRQFEKKQKNIEVAFGIRFIVHSLNSIGHV